jgi:hypothetical protein
VIRAHAANLPFATSMPQPNASKGKSFRVFTDDFFNVQFHLPVAPPAHPKPAALLPCDFTLRIVTASGRVIDSRSPTSLPSELFPYRASTVQTFYVGDPIYLSEGVYQVELENRADTPAFQTRGAELRLEPHETIASRLLTWLALLADAVFSALGLLLLVTLNGAKLNQRRDAA